MNIHQLWLLLLLFLRSKINVLIIVILIEFYYYLNSICIITYNIYKLCSLFTKQFVFLPQTSLY